MFCEHLWIVTLMSSVVVAIDIKKICEVKVELSDRMINVMNKHELCSCLEYEKISLTTHKISEPCNLKIINSGEQLVISADSICECAGYQTNATRKIGAIRTDTTINFTTASTIKDYVTSDHKETTVPYVPITEHKVINATNFTDFIVASVSNSTVTEKVSKKREVTEIDEFKGLATYYTKATETSGDRSHAEVKFSNRSGAIHTTDKIETHKSTISLDSKLSNSTILHYDSSSYKYVDYADPTTTAKFHNYTTPFLYTNYSTPTVSTNIDKVETINRTVTDIIFPLKVVNTMNSTGTTARINRVSGVYKEYLISTMKDIVTETVERTTKLNTTDATISTLSEEMDYETYTTTSFTKSKLNSYINATDSNTTKPVSETTKVSVYKGDYSNKTVIPLSKINKSTTNNAYTSQVPTKMATIHYKKEEVLNNTTKSNFGITNNDKIYDIDLNNTTGDKSDGSISTVEMINITTSLMNITESTPAIKASDSETYKVNEDRRRNWVINIVLIAILCILCAILIILLFMKMFHRFFRTGSYVIQRSSDKNIEMESKQ